MAHHEDLVNTHGTIHIYTDGSEIEGKVGAAAVLLKPREILQAYLGNKEQTTVYGAELQGIQLATTLARAELRRNSHISQVHIYTDNQAAIRSNTEIRRQSGQYIATQNRRLLDGIKNDYPQTR